MSSVAYLKARVNGVASTCQYVCSRPQCVDGWCIIIISDDSATSARFNTQSPSECLDNS
jgi:hypothetical protein